MAGPTIHQNQHSDFIGTVDPDPSCSSPDCFEALKEKDTCVDNCDTRSSFRIHHPSRDADQHREQCEVFKTVSAKDRHVMHHCLPYSNNDSTFQLSLVLPHRDLEAGECKYQDPLIDPHHIAEHQHEPGLLSVAWQPDERFLKHSVTCEDFANKSACSNAYSEASSGNEKHQRITKTLSSATYNLENLSEANVANSESNSELMLKQLSNADIVGMSEDKTLRSNSTEGTHGGRRSSLHADIHKLLSPWENDWMSCCSGMHFSHSINVLRMLTSQPFSVTFMLQTMFKTSLLSMWVRCILLEMQHFHLFVLHTFLSELQTYVIKVHIKSLVEPRR